jgi:hypothetical protein
MTLVTRRHLRTGPSRGGLPRGGIVAMALAAGLAGACGAPPPDGEAGGEEPEFTLTEGALVKGDFELVQTALTVNPVTHQYKGIVTIRNRGNTAMNVPVKLGTWDNSHSYHWDPGYFICSSRSSRSSNMFQYHHPGLPFNAVVTANPGDQGAWIAFFFDAKQGISSPVPSPCKITIDPRDFAQGHEDFNNPVGQTCYCGGPYYGTWTETSRPSPSQSILSCAR